jgi:hypothetical protein
MHSGTLIQGGIGVRDIVLNATLNNISVISWRSVLLVEEIGPITNKVVSSNPLHDEVYSIEYYVIKFVSDLRQVGYFHRFPPPIKRTATIKLKYC